MPLCQFVRPAWRLRRREIKVKSDYKMPLTPAEKQKRYREKLKSENPVKYEEMKKKTAECALRYYKRKTSQFTEQEKEERRQKWRDERKQLKQAEQDKAKDLNVRKNVQKEQTHKEYMLRLENYEIRKEINTLRKRFETLRKKCYRQSKKIDYLNKELHDIKENLLKTTITNEEQERTKYERSEVRASNEETPTKQTERFIRENLPNLDASQKEIVNKKLLEHNVLSESLKKEYRESVGTEKNTLKKIVTSDIVKKYKLKNKLKHTLGLKANIRKSRDRKIKKNIILNEINEFYNRDDNSRATAGRKEYKTKNKIKLQRRYLLATIRKLHEKYVSEGGKVSLSTFKKYRPFNILTPKISDRDTCVCVKHSNMTFMVKKLKQLAILESDDLNDVTSKLVCDTSSKICMYGLCEFCKNNTIRADETEVCLNEIITWPVWMQNKHEYGEEGNKKTTKKMEKAEREGSIEDLITVINSDMKKFLNHTYNISHQYKNYKFCIANLKENETVIHIDFSENYICKLHTEIQAMHFGSSKVQITLHTGVIYIKSLHKPISFCSLSPANIHSPEAIWAHLEPILQYLNEKYPQVDTIHFFSDGPTSQYRNKKNFYLFSQIQSFGFNHATWSFFEAAHGKGAADGIGGAVKRTLDSKVAHGEDIPDAQTAFEILSKTDSAIKVFYIPPENIKLLQDKIVKKLHPLPNTLKIHQIILNSKNEVNFRDLSCFCKNLSGRCDCHSIKTHRFEISKNKLQKIKTIRQNLTKAKATRNIKKIVTSSSTSSTESIEIEYLDDSDTTHFSEPYQEEYLDECCLAVDEVETKLKKDFVDKILEKEDTINENTYITKKVTILSDIRNLPYNKRYFDLKQFDRLQFKTINSNFDLCFVKKSSVDTISAENIDPYTNPVASSSGINKSSRTKEIRDCNNIEDSEKTVAKEFFFNLKNLDAVTTEKKDNIFKTEYTDLNTLERNNNIKTEDSKERCNPDLTISVEAIENEKIEDNEYKDMNIKINQNVLVRYYNRKNWKYYIGRVEEINTAEDKYTVNFLKTIKIPSLKFVITKKIDRDIVSSFCIVKTIELDTSDKKNEYLLKNQFDVTYFN